MNGVDSLYENIQKGKDGKNIGVSTGIPKLDSIIYGIQQKYLYVIGADSGSGKTALAVYSFVYELLKNAGGRKINLLYYSFELSADVLFAKLLSLYIYDTHKKIVTYEDILSLTKPISEEHLELVNSCRDWVVDVSKKLTIYDKPLSPQAIYGVTKEWLRRFGEFTEINEHKEEYSQNDPDEYKVAILDHCGLLAGSESKKQKIDTVCDYFIYFRNKCNMTGVFVQQINRNSKSVERKKGGYELLDTNDLSDTSGTAQAAEVVIMLYYPHREKIAKCEGYNIQNGLRNRGRIIQVCKNRYGRSDISIGSSFYGEIGKFIDLPLPSEITDYEPYITLEEDFTPPKIETKQDNESKEDKDDDEFMFKL